MTESELVGTTLGVLDGFNVGLIVGLVGEVVKRVGLLVGLLVKIVGLLLGTFVINVGTSVGFVLGI
jgi:hypothetical protein